MDKLTDYELELLIQQVEEHEMLRAPTRLKCEIIEKSQRIQKQNIQRLSLPQKQITRAAAKTELIVYSFKTAAAVAVAVFLFAFVNQPALQAELRFNRYHSQGNNSLSFEYNRDGNNEIPRRNWQISNILQEVNRKMEGFLGGYVW